ncbi:hypothetical protein [Sideroxydans lithotrophicus]|uniref:Uncharacterized protein n=1 Tax=Sideroxydans lithotrophicus (strain ES-1) TaxID=580332 RepID=D5CMB3_SIDLE|nr:hypothetical protein [Sideroxydans lithotrophicus]ADE10727.1 conserved hypothetical protein [Sideroxydans lithotrophicus ES-1]
MNFLFQATGAVIVTLAIFSEAYGFPGESIVLDPNTGNYQITYFGEGSPGNKKNKPLRQAIFVPATKINPVIGSTFRLRGMDIVAYSYRVKNSTNSRQSLANFVIDPVSDINSSSPLPKLRQSITVSDLDPFNKIALAAIYTPRNWVGSVWISDTVGLRIGWMFASLEAPNAGLIAGSTQDGFGFSSKDIPGIGIVQFQGNTPVFGFVDEGPSGEISDQLDKLTHNNFVPRNAAVPTIAVPEPFDTAILLDRIRSQVATWPAKQLLDPAFAAQLDRHLVSATNAFRLNNSKAGKEQIETMRNMLGREHKYLDHDDEDNEDTTEHKTVTRLTIDRLAARVLDFDLRYVLKRTEYEHENSEKRKER